MELEQAAAAALQPGHFRSTCPALGCSLHRSMGPSGNKGQAARARSRCVTAARPLNTACLVLTLC